MEGGGLLHRQVTGVGALQNLVDIDRSPSKVVRNAWAIGGEGAGLGESQLEYSWESVPQRALHDRFPVIRESSRGQLEESASALTAGCLERGIEICEPAYRQ